MIPHDLEYPDFLSCFGTEQACVTALFDARWPGGYSCPACNFRDYYLISTRRLPLYECASCGLQTSITASTVMAGSRTPLTSWFHAMYLLSRSNGISALRLSESIHVSYKTAWLIAHKIRNAMSAADATVALCGNIRVDRCHYGDSIYDDARQPLLIGASLRDDEQPDYVKIKQPHPGHVDEAKRFIKPEGIRAFYETHTDSTERPELRLFLKANPNLLQIVRQVNSWLNLTFNGIGAKHLQSYLNEFTFRINCIAREAVAFAETARWCARTPVLTYPRLIAPRPMLQPPWLIYGSRSRWKGKHMSRWGA